MPETSPPSISPPTTNGGGAVYVVVVILLVAAIGGLVFWKLKGSNQSTAQVNPLPQIPTQPALPEPPPPPPPVEEAIATPDSGVVKAVTGGAYNACNGKCSGSASA